MFFSLFQLLKQQPYKIHPLAKKLQMIGVSNSLKQRFERHQTLWQEHLNQSHQEIIQFAGRHSQASSVTVLGSSHLFEVPENFLLERFRFVQLVDLVHPPKVVALAKKYPDKIKLVCEDVTGALHNLSQIQSVEDVIKSFPCKKPALEATDLVISANLASQLHLFFLEELNSQKIATTKEEKDQIAQVVIHDHLDWLATMNCPVLLISDRKVTYKDAQGQVTYSGTYALEMRDFQLINTWNWPMASLGEISPLYSLEMEVHSFERK